MASLLFPFPVTNSSAQAVSSAWRVQPVDISAVAADPVFHQIKADPMPITGFGLIKHRCDQFLSRKQALPVEELKLKLEPGTRIGLALVVDTKTKIFPGAPLQLALFALSEQRSDGSVGGMLVAVTSNGGSFVVGPENLAPNPAPLALVDGPRFQSSPPFEKGPVQAVIDRRAGAGFVGLLMRNNSGVSLKSVVVYTECVSLPGVRWEPRVFAIEELEPGGEFFAAFPLDPSFAEESEGIVRLVGYSAAHDPTRFDIALRVVDFSQR